MNNILDKLILPGYEDFKCFDLLKHLITNEEFCNNLETGINNGYVTPFDFDLWNKIKNNFSFDFMNEFRVGNNIGGCFSFSKIFGCLDSKFILCQGDNKYLNNTKNSLNGEHFWLELNGYIYDTSLMIKVSSFYINKLGYTLKNSKYMDSFTNYELEQAFYIKGSSKKF